MNNQLIPDEQFQTAIPTENGLTTVQSLNTESPSNNDLIDTYGLNEITFVGTEVDYQNLNNDNELITPTTIIEDVVVENISEFENLDPNSELITPEVIVEEEILETVITSENLDPNTELIVPNEQVEKVSTPLFYQGTCFDNLNSQALIDSIEKLYRYLCEVLIRFDSSPNNYQKEDYEFLIKTITNSLIYLYNRDQQLGDLEKVVRFVGIAELDTDPIQEALIDDYFYPGIYLADKVGEYEGFQLTLTQEELNGSVILFLPVIQNNEFINYRKQLYSLNLDYLTPIQEHLIGVIDGVNTVFTTTYSYKPGSLTFFLNGLKESHFQETAENEITLSYAPQTTGFTDILEVIYTKLN